MPSTGLSGGGLALDQMTSTTYVPPASPGTLQQAQQQAAKLERVPSAPAGRAVPRRSSSFSLGGGQQRNMSLEADRARRASMEGRAVKRQSSSSSIGEWSESRSGFWNLIPRIGRFGGRGQPDQPDRLETITSVLPRASDERLARARVLAARMGN